MPERLSTRALPGRVDLDALFVALEKVSTEVFWLDAGATATQGWSVIGTGAIAPFPGEVRLDAGPSDADLSDADPTPGRPPLRGGWVGWYDYESGAREAGAPVAPHGDTAGGAWLRITHLVALDHTTGRTWISAPPAELEEWASFASASGAQAPSAPRPPRADTAPPSARARHSPDEYASLIERCRELIRAGIAYQLCLTTRFTVDGPHDAVEAYRRLRRLTPAHHGGFLRIGGRSLLSASPEQFLDVRDGVVRTRPIKGTRPRSDDPVHDAALAADLAADPKERAENVMIVDLMRNDLSRVCEPGSIRVEALWAVESYPAVHQLVSTVSGVLTRGTTSGELLRATFPAGSMTGAPKLSAMTRLHEIEGGPRGVYAGCFGYIGDDGALDLAMVIRSIVMEGDTAVVGAGGGITWRSVAAAEVAEVATKARAPLAALGAEMPAAWASDILN